MTNLNLLKSNLAPLILDRADYSEISEALKNISLESIVSPSGLETYVPEIKSICRKLFEQSGLLLKCSLGHTQEKYKAEYKHQWIYQLNGNSLWIFPYIDNKPAKDLSSRPKLNQKLNELKVEFATKEIELSEGQILYIPYGQSFKAHSRSNYLIFSEDEINAREILTFLNEEIIGIKNFEDHFFEAFNPETVLQSMVPLTPIESKQKASSFLTKVKMMKFKYSSKST